MAFFLCHIFSVSISTDLKYKTMRKKIEETLERKLAEAQAVKKWFEDEYEPAMTDEDVVAEWEKNGSNIHAQIQILRFLLDD